MCSDEAVVDGRGEPRHTSGSGRRWTASLLRRCSKGGGNMSAGCVQRVYVSAGEMTDSLGLMQTDV